MNLSLRHRLSLSACIVLCLFLGIIGLVLDQAFSLSLDNIVREKLKLHIYTLLSIADNEKGRVKLPATLSEQRFNIAEGSLIAIVTDSNRRESWRSGSAGDKRFELPIPEQGDWLFGRAKDDSGDSYYVSSYSTIWTDSQGQKTTFVFTVMENFNYYRQDLADYQFAVVVIMVTLGAILLILQAIILRWSLKPLRGLANDVNAMNRRELSSLAGNYPKELQPLTNNLNRLIDNERRQRQRYRDRMADLSHSLKTPLSVLRGVESDTDENGQVISREQLLDTLHRQVSRMSDIVDYQLQRAVVNGQQSSFIATPIAEKATSIIAALDKVYADKAISTEINIDNNLAFYGDENDLIEILGNLLDNAYKHGKQQVTISAQLSNDFLQLSIEDDGEGVPESRHKDILKRGVRLDSTSEGQGFGLAIAVEIINSYQGNISIGRSTLNGAKFNVDIPTR